MFFRRGVPLLVEIHGRITMTAATFRGIVCLELTPDVLCELGAMRLEVRRLRELAAQVLVEFDARLQMLNQTGMN